VLTSAAAPIFGLFIVAGIFKKESHNLIAATGVGVIVHFSASALLAVTLFL
jgi:hypothetical protein